MKKLALITLCLIIVLSLNVFSNIYFYFENIFKPEIEYKNFKTGDIIFQTSKSDQSKAIQIATNSVYSHCGLIIVEQDNYYVIEAAQRVSKTKLEKFIKKGKDEHYVVKRLKIFDNVFNNDVTNKIILESKKLIGKSYDSYFDWSDDQYYCSELVWKIYMNTTGIEVGKLMRLHDYNLENDLVKTTLINRYGNKIPYHEFVISPKSIFSSDNLIEVYSSKKLK